MATNGERRVFSFPAARVASEMQEGENMNHDVLDDAQSSIVREMIEARREYGDLAEIKRQRPDLFRSWAERLNLKQEVLRHADTRDVTHTRGRE